MKICGGQSSLGTVFQTRNRCIAYVLVAGLACWPGSAAAGVAADQSIEAAPTIVIDGPPPPVLPDVVARDPQGRVTMRAIRLESPDSIRMDGLLDEPIYRRIPAVGGFIQQEPHEGAPATEKTEPWVFFDSRNIYVSARCFDSHPERMVLNEMRRDNFNIYQNENFTVVLDTFYTRRSGFFFQTNPLGAIRDQEVTSERDNNNDWNTVWDSRSATFSQGWTMEMVIPFKSLRYRQGGPQIWGINLRRVVRWKNEQTFLAPVPASYGFRAIYKFSSAATLVGLETPSASRNLELKPYAIAALTTNRMAAVPFSNDVNADAGLDVKYGLTRGLIADVTYNTDFAQVEADEQQVNLTRFSLFFPEKRDFFLEGQGLFVFGGTQQAGGAPVGGGGGGAGNSRLDVPDVTPVLFFSRNIGLASGQAVPIRAGGRLTGRAGKFTIGALEIQTGDDESVKAVATNFAAFRLKRDILRRSAVGVIATNRSRSTTGPENNTAIGLDANLAFYQNINIATYYASTWTDGVSSTAARRASYRAQFDYAADRYGVQVEHLNVGEDFDPQLGFLRRQDFRRTFGLARFSPRPTSSRLVRKYTYQATLDYITDPQGSLETREAQATFATELSNSDQMTVDYTRSFDFLEQPFEIASGVFLPPGGYSFQDVRTQYLLGQQRRVSGTLILGHGSFYSGNKTEAGYSGRIKVTPQVAIEPRVSINRVDLAEGHFTAKLLGARAIFTFTPRVFFSSLVQYNSSVNSVNSNLRFRWEYRPGSEFFVVYTDERNTGVLGRLSELANRGLVVKVNRFIRF